MNKIREFKESVCKTATAISRVFRAIWPKHRFILVVFLFIAVILSFMPFLSSAAQALLINEFVSRDVSAFTPIIIVCLILMIGASYFSDLLRSLQVLANKHLWMGITEFFELTLLKKRSVIDVATYEDPKFQDLLGKASDKGIWPICNLVEIQFQQVTNLAQLVMAAGVFFVFDWRFFLLALASSVPSFVVQFKYGKSSWDIWDEDAETRRKYGSLRRHFFSVNRLTELKVFQNAGRFFSMIAGMYRVFNGKQKKLENRAFWWRFSANAVSMLMQAVIYGWVVWLVIHGRLQVGTMTFLLGSLGRFEGALVGLFNNLARQFEWSLYSNDIFKVLDTEPSIKQAEKPACFDTSVSPLVEFKNVSFAYPGTDRLILRNVNLTIRSGERLAIVGLNGAGKSTLIKLLMRFYDPTEGAIMVNGINLKDLDLEDWGSVIAPLFQSYADYNFPIREVIALGRANGCPRGRMEKVVSCAEAVDAHSFIDLFSNKYEQMIGKEFDGGIDLSVGQSQKTALARALYRDPKVMILDEPTASIDASAEARIFERLEKDAGECTQIVISHRFSTVRRSDRICVLEEGVISELGSHEELMADGKTYAKLFKLQASAYV